MILSEKGRYVDINWNRTFIDAGKLASYVYYNEGPFVVTGGLDLDSKREAAAIIKNLHTAIQKHGTPSGNKGWKEVAETASRIG